MPAVPPAFDWRARFQVWGCYQDLRLDGRDWPARSRLELFSHGLSPRQAIDGRPDLVAVMMNPGSSRPLEPTDALGWAPAQPDRTQLQLMKLAVRAETDGIVVAPVQHIRVLNLSDLRTPQSAELFGWLAGLSDGRHSLFDPARSDERERLLGDGDTPILRAWGLGKALSALASQAVRATAGRRVLGLSEEGLLYRHPLPQHAQRQREWLDAVLGQWRALAPRPQAPQGLPLSSNGAIL